MVIPIGMAVKGGLTAARNSGTKDPKGLAERAAAAVAPFSSSSSRLSRLRIRRRPTGIERGFYRTNQRAAAAEMRRKASEMAARFALPKLPKAPTEMVPKTLKPVPPPRLQAAGAPPSSAEARDLFTRLGQWIRENGPVLILNIGSLCTLSGFMRSDVLELRALSMIGSMSSVTYFSFTRPLPLAPICWSSIFAMTNAYNIYKILDERGNNVVLSSDEENCFVEHFMPHGLTPKQFKVIMAKANRVTVPEGTVISRQGVAMNSVYLVVRGDTRGSAFGRRMSAASSRTENRIDKEGGDSGAWIGDVTFLEIYWHKDQQLSENSMPLKEKLSTTGIEEMEGADQTHDGKESEVVPEGSKDMAPATIVSTKEEPDQRHVGRPSTTGRALYTVVSEEECELLVWSHEDLAEIMETSSDMRAAMTRAMTAAVVGKVVNFTVSKHSGLKTWSTWLDDWKHSGGASVNIKAENNSGIAHAAHILKEQIVSS